MRNITEAYKKVITETNNSKEYNFEGDMAKKDLEIIIMHAERLTGMLEDSENLPEWVQSKITLAKDYVQTVSDYLYAEKGSK